MISTVLFWKLSIGFMVGVKNLVSPVHWTFLYKNIFDIHKASLISFCFFSLRCFGVASCLRGADAAPYPHTVWGLVEKGPEGERKVWSHCFSPVFAEELHFEETSQYLMMTVMFLPLTSIVTEPLLCFYWEDVFCDMLSKYCTTICLSTKTKRGIKGLR